MMKTVVRITFASLADQGDLGVCLHQSHGKNVEYRKNSFYRWATIDNSLIFVSH